jgi:hypothetical protein
MARMVADQTVEPIGLGFLQKETEATEKAFPRIARINADWMLHHQRPSG